MNLCDKRVIIIIIGLYVLMSWNCRVFVQIGIIHVIIDIIKMKKISIIIINIRKNPIFFVFFFFFFFFFFVILMMQFQFQARFLVAHPQF